MSCCELGSPPDNRGAVGYDDAFGRAERQGRVRVDADGRGSCLLSVPGISCGGCIAAVERALGACDSVVAARANPDAAAGFRDAADPRLRSPAGAVETRGGGVSGDACRRRASRRATETRQASSLLTCLAVAGFGAANVMLLSVSVWAGAEGASREAFHLLSALIALPVAAFAGRPFFGSALTAIRAGRLNMDVPISLAVLLALALSVVETARGGAHVFYDAALVLLFFLLIGRYLDQRMRARARSAVTGLTRLAAKGAMREDPDGASTYTALEAIELGMALRIHPGERIPGDGAVLAGTTDLDRSLVTGEHSPCPAAEKIARLEDLRPARVDGRRWPERRRSARRGSCVGGARIRFRCRSAGSRFTRDDLTAEVTAHRIAGRAARLVVQNFWLAVLYNGIAIPLAVTGYVTPLVAAIAMSASSVVGNSLRFSGVGLNLTPPTAEAEEVCA